MAKSKPVPELSDEDLRSQRNTMRAILGVVAAIAVIYLAVAGYLVANGKAKAQLAFLSVPFLAMTVSTMPAMIRMSALDAEIKRRASSGSGR